MPNWLQRLWRDEQGSASVEWLVLTSILLLGTVFVLAALHQSIATEIQTHTAPLQDH
jgi:Flp pilus assembly pilin Flp